MNITHTIRVLLDDGRCERHYVESEEPELCVFDDFMFFDGNSDEWIGWKIDGAFYLRENVTGVKIEPFKGIVADINGYQVICPNASDLPLAIRNRQAACASEINALEAYLKGLGNVHPDEKYAGSGCCARDARPEDSDPPNKRPNP
jgi:hypothetical protein